MSQAVARLQRVIAIQRLSLEQIPILETMTPMDFLEFRDMLYPASGFQSFQFRLIENKLGLRPEQRLRYNHASYLMSLPQEHQDILKAVEKQDSLFDCVQKWLERTPFLHTEGFDFWVSYQKSVHAMFEEDRQTVKANSQLSKEDQAHNLQIINQAEENFASLFDETKYKQACQNQHWRLSYRAIHAALLIQLYRDQPAFHLPFRLITALLDIDETMTHWRYRHALMAQRMLGSKIGTGGSSGSAYLKAATNQHKIFNDFFQLTTFFVPRSRLPELPPEVQKQLSFYYAH